MKYVWLSYYVNIYFLRDEYSASFPSSMNCVNVKSIESSLEPIPNGQKTFLFNTHQLHVNQRVDYKCYERW